MDTEGLLKLLNANKVFFLPDPTDAKLSINSKHEIRNPKQIRMTKIQMAETKTRGNQIIRGFYFEF
jgi:hypothetical protein